MGRRARKREAGQRKGAWGKVLERDLGFVGSGDRMAKGGGNWGAVTGLVGVGWAVG